MPEEPTKPADAPELPAPASATAPALPAPSSAAPLPAPRDSAASIPPVSAPPQFRALVVIVLVLGVASFFTMRGLFAPVVVAAWFAGLTSPLVARVSRRLGGRQRVAALATVVLVLLIVAPIVGLSIPLINMVGDTVEEIRRAPSDGALGRLVEAVTGSRAPAGGGAARGAGTMQRAMELARSVAPSAAGFVSRTFNTLSAMTMQLFILAVSAYYFSAQGSEIVTWLRKGSPIGAGHFRRLTQAFMDVARAMLMGELLTAIAQGVVAGVVYAILGVPRALFFALLTGFASLIPTVGSALVWVPLCGVLVIAGRTREAIILAICGVVVIGTVDNILRPIFSRLGADRMHPLLLFIGIFGGIEVYGGWGLILGPLVLSLFVAAYRLYADEMEVHRAAQGG